MPRKAIGPPRLDGCQTELRADRPPKPPLLTTSSDGPAIVSLFPGESACFEVEIQGKEFRPVRLVQAPSPGARHIGLSTGMFDGQFALVVRHSESRGMRYTARPVVRLDDGNFGVMTTSTCTVRPEVFSMELWHDPIEIMVVGGFHLTDEQSCRE